MVIISQFFTEEELYRMTLVNAWGSGHHHEISNSLPVASERDILK